MKIINMTPHPIVILDDQDEEIITLLPSGNLIRLDAETKRTGRFGEIPISETRFGDLQGLPKMAIGVWYIVSQVVKNALPDRLDLLVPAEVVRNETGQIVGCRSLGK